MPKYVLENLSKMNIGRQEMINNGFSAQKYDDIQRGKSSLKLDDLVAISEKFQLSLDYLVYGKEKSHKSELSSLQIELLDRFELLSEVDKGRILDRMQSMYEAYTPEQKESV